MVFVGSFAFDPIEVGKEDGLVHDVVVRGQLAVGAHAEPRPDGRFLSRDDLDDADLVEGVSVIPVEGIGDRLRPEAQDQAASNQKQTRRPVICLRME